MAHGYAGVPDTGNYVGFSEDCLAVSLANIDGVIEKLKGGSIVFAGLGETR